VTPNSRMVNPFLQSSLEVRYALCTTPKSHLFAEIVPPFPAYATLATWYPYLKGDAVANSEVIDLWADGNHYAGGFMAKGQRCARTKITIGKLLIIAHI
jgi:hypothetical protein